MFTGIVTAVATVRAIEAGQGRDTRFTLEGPDEAASIAIGASICHDGVCLTVMERADVGGGIARWLIEASRETLDLTTMGQWAEGRRVNIERSLKVGDELGGHIVSGHVDGIGACLSVTPENGSHRVRLRAPRPLHRFIAKKGSVAIDGVSLTVNEVEDDVFGINVIAHTWAVTTLGGLVPGRPVNLEVDLMARYAARLMETRDA
jgi:riboflavin synthase